MCRLLDAGFAAPALTLSPVYVHRAIIRAPSSPPERTTLFPRSITGEKIAFSTNYPGCLRITHALCHALACCFNSATVTF